MKRPFEEEVFAKYGAPMGRRSDDLVDLVTKVHLQRVPFVDGDYDPGGAYWGSGGLPLYCAWGETETMRVEYYLRAHNRDGAKQHLLFKFPGLRFYR